MRLALPTRRRLFIVSAAVIFLAGAAAGVAVYFERFADPRADRVFETRGCAGCALADIRLWWADLRGFDFSNADLARARLWWADIRDGNLSGADLHEASFWWAKLDKIDLSHADLNGARMGHATLRESSLRGAAMKNADLIGANPMRAPMCVRPI